MFYVQQHQQYKLILRNALDDPAPTGSPSAPAPGDTLPLPQQPDVLVTSALYRFNQLVVPDGLTDRVVDLDSLYPTPPTGNTRKRKARPPNGDVGRDLFRRPAVVRNWNKSQSLVKQKVLRRDGWARKIGVNNISNSLQPSAKYTFISYVLAFEKLLIMHYLRI